MREDTMQATSRLGRRIYCLLMKGLECEGNMMSKARTDELVGKELAVLVVLDNRNPLRSHGACLLTLRLCRSQASAFEYRAHVHPSIEISCLDSANFSSTVSPSFWARKHSLLSLHGARREY